MHGDFHHHNILRDGDRFVAIDPKPYLAEREYDVPSFLWNPLDNRMDDREQTERRIAAFVAAGLDDFRIRAWTVIRGAYLRPDCAEAILRTWMTTAPICPACGVTMVPGALSAHEPADEWVCLECEEDGLGRPAAARQVRLREPQQERVQLPALLLVERREELVLDPARERAQAAERALARRA